MTDNIQAQQIRAIKAKLQKSLKEKENIFEGDLTSLIKLPEWK